MQTVTVSILSCSYTHTHYKTRARRKLRDSHKTSLYHRLKQWEMEKNGEKEKSNGGDRDADSIITVRIDTKFLDCSICSNPLLSPVHQCKNGHVACSLCSSKDNKKCSECCCELTCCPGLGAIINSIKISCPNSSFGCKLNIPYTQKVIHDQFCPYAPCSCPVPDCAFTGPVPELNAHFKSVHLALYRPQTPPLGSSYFWYDQVLKQDEPFLVFEGDDSHLFLLLNRRDIPSGNSLSVLCIGPSHGNQLVYYQLRVASSYDRNVYLQLKAHMTSTREWKGVYPSNNFLFVPHEFCSGSCIRVDVSIKKLAVGCSK